MSSQVLLHELRPIEELLQVRELQLRNYLFALRPADVLDEGHFERLRTQVRQAVLLEPVMFDEPAISLHYVGKGPKPSLIRWVAGKILSKFVPIVSIAFHGSRELFSYVPDDFEAHADWQMVQPDGNALWVSISLPFVSRDLVLNEAQAMLGLTMQVIERNNAIVREWSARMESRIEEQLEKRRRELLANVTLR